MKHCRVPEKFVQNTCGVWLAERDYYLTGWIMTAGRTW